MQSFAFTKPFLFKWPYLNTFKPLWFLGIAGTSSIALATTIFDPTEEVKSNFKKGTEKISYPLSPVLNYGSTGSKKIIDTLGNWTKYVGNLSDPVKKFISTQILKDLSISNGARQIFGKLKEWTESIFKFLTEHFPKLAEKNSWIKLQKQINNYGPLVTNFLTLLGNLSKLQMGGDNSLLSEMFKAMEKDNFGNFASAMSNLAKENPKLFNDLNGQDIGDLVSAFNSDEKGTTKVLENFAKQENGERDQLMNALRPATLKARIDNAISKAEYYLGKGDLKNEEDKNGAKEAQNELKKLYAEVTEIITKAQAQAQAQAQKV